MLKKSLVIVMLLMLVAHGALAASGEGDTNLVTPNQPIRYAVKTFTEGMRERLTFNLERKAAVYLEHAGERLKEFEALQKMDFDTLKARLLERHDALVAKAEEVIANTGNLSDYIKTKAIESQVKALELAQEKAAEFENQELATKWLNMVKTKQEYVLARIEENADTMAEHMLERAQQVLSNKDETRAKIEAAQSLEELRELRQGQRPVKRPMQRLRGTIKGGMMKFGR